MFHSPRNCQDSSESHHRTGTTLCIESPGVWMGFNCLGFFGKPYLWLQSSSGFEAKPCAAQVHCSAIWGWTALLPRGHETVCLVSPLCPWESRQGQLTQRTTSAKIAFKDPYYCFNRSGSASFLQGQGPGPSCLRQV